MQTTFYVGDRAVYPGRGVTEITGLQHMSISGSTMEFYVLRVLDNNMKVMVPKHNAEAVGLRRLVGEHEVNAVYGVLRARGGKISTATWNRRHREYMEKINTGSLVEIATVLRDLCILRNRKQLSSGEREMLDTARSLLVQELALAKGRAENDVATELDAMFS